MTKMRRKYDREFKLSVVAELEGGKPLVQIAREHGIHPSLPCRWRDELANNPEAAFKGNGRKYKEAARIDELERLLGQLYAENELLKKALSVLEGRVREERAKTRLGGGT
jgi:transposase